MKHIEPKLTTKKALIYCRVSSDRQVTQGHGLDSQEKLCRDYASGKGYEIMRVFRDEGISGGFLDRPGINALLDYLDEHIKQIDIVIFDDLSRLARDIAVYLQLKNLLNKRSVKLESPNFIFDESPIGEAMEMMSVIFAQLQRRENRRQVIQKMKARLLDGFWCFCPPPGLVNVKHPSKGKLLQANEPQASIYKAAIEGYANNLFFTLEEVRQFILNEYQKTGITRPLSIHGTQEILTELLYTGYMEFKPWGIEFKKGKHDGFITLETYNRVQEKMSGKSKPPLRKDYSLDFPLRGFVTCATCNNPMTASWNKGRSNRYPNYWCRTPNCLFKYRTINKNRIESDFETLLEVTSPPSEAFRLAKEIFIEAWEKNKTNYKQQSSRSTQELKELDIRTQNYFDRISKTKDDELIGLYEKEIKKLNEQKRKIHLDSNTPLFSQSDFGTVVTVVLKTLEKPLQLWKSDDLQQKRNIIGMYFDDRVPYSHKEGFGTVDLSLPIRLISQLSDRKSASVEMPGFEPGSEKTQSKTFS
ncbi:MAG: hypothetical protein RI947_1463 [Candidatus Parcubacteria bacterium]